MHRFNRIVSCLATLGVFLTAFETASAGTITGTVRAHGAEQAAGAGDGGGQYSSRRYKFLERVDYEEMTDFVVYVDQPMTGEAPEATLRAAVAQRDGMFAPRVLAIAAGTTVNFPNEDDIFHNVFSISETQPFDLELYKRGAPAKEVTFFKPGRVDVFCSIHTQMNGIICVTPNTWFAKTDSRGRFTLPELPAGTYTISIWHERMPKLTEKITVGESEEITKHFVAGLKSLPKL
ncbi:MAG: hypothetical protein ACREIA_00295 [Opitutaceae bacterium]